MPLNYHTIRLTAAADVTLPVSGLHLVRVRMSVGATGGAFRWRYGGSSQALFVAGTDGTRGKRTFYTRHKMEGTTIPAGAQTFTGDVNWVELIFANEAPNKGEPLEWYRGVLARRTDAGAVTADITTNFDAAPAKPKRVEVYISADEGRIAFPSIGSYTPRVEALISQGEVEATPAPDLEEANTITLSAITDGASTIMAAIYY